MIKYKAYEVELSYEGQSIIASGKVVRKIDDAAWEEIGDFHTSVKATKDVEEIARKVLVTVGGIARKDFVVNTILAEADALIEAHTFEYFTEP